MSNRLAGKSVDDLMAYLRSDSPLPPRAPLGPRAPRIAAAPGLPLSPIRAATLRRPPRAAERYIAATRAANRASGDYSEQRRREEHARHLRQTECRLVAWLVCRSLGAGWRFENGDSDYRSSYKLVHRATTASLSFRYCWRDESRYEISPDNVYRTDSMPKSITVSGDRSPASIAADIERRIIDAGLFEQNAAVLSGAHDRRADHVRKRREVLAVARAYGGDLRAQRGWKHDYEPSGTAEHYGPAADEYSNRGSTEISVSHGYNGLDISVTTKDIKLAMQVGELVKNYYAAAAV